MAWEGLTPPYSTIVVDPPWPYDEHAYGRPDKAFLPYSSMPVEDIAALPVADLAAPGAHLYLWTTNRYLEDAPGIVRMWGFSPTNTLVWCKDPGLGSGGRFAVTTEFVICAQAPRNTPPRKATRVGAQIRAAREAAGLTVNEVRFRIRGGKWTGVVHNWEADISLPNEQDWVKLQTLLPQLADVPRPEIPPPPPRETKPRNAISSTWFRWPKGPHSTKPPAFLDLVEKVSPDPYVELFARQPRLGWDSWGWGYEQAG